MHLLHTTRPGKTLFTHISVLIGLEERRCELLCHIIQFIKAIFCSGGAKELHVGYMVM